MGILNGLIDGFTINIKIKESFYKKKICLFRLLSMSREQLVVVEANTAPLKRLLVRT